MNVILRPPSRWPVCQAAVIGILLTCVMPNRVNAVESLNANPSVKYIGSQACIECHQDEHRTWLETSHSKSMEKVDLEKEMLGSSFRHQASGNDYEVLRQGDQMLHREIIRGSDGSELATTQYPIVYTMGSGAHGKSYIYQSGAFFGQSPLSWYQETQKWGMSPGYDLAFHPGFQRKLNSECFFCHVGSIDRKEGNPNVFSILEETIGCERCHGPGELHAKKYRENPEAMGTDETIVNPATLPRELSESICQQCHLQAAGKAFVSGKDEWDFRPGLPLTDFRIDFQYRLGDDTMRVVGHVEQLHMSECYKQTENLTCITCHNPHQTPDPEGTKAYYRSICLNCHEDDACGEPHDKRMSIAQNDCSQCHMPKLGSEVPHTAFSHHRIGIHRPSQGENEVIAGLTPVLGDSNLTATEISRCEAIAKFQVAQEQADIPSFRDYGMEAAKSLIQIKNAGKADADVNAVLAMLALSQRQPTIAQDLATEVVENEKVPSRARIEAVRLLAQLAYQRRDYATAAKHYRQLTTYVEEPYDFFYLGLSEQNGGDSDRAIEALKRSVALDPGYLEAHRVLSAILKSKGRSDEAARHAKLADQHESRMDQLWQQSQKKVQNASPAGK